MLLLFLRKKSTKRQRSISFIVNHESKLYVYLKISWLSLKLKKACRSVGHDQNQLVPLFQFCGKMKCVSNLTDVARKFKDQLAMVKVNGQSIQQIFLNLQVYLHAGNILVKFYRTDLGVEEKMSCFF